MDGRCCTLQSSRTVEVQRRTHVRDAFFLLILWLSAYDHIRRRCTALESLNVSNCFLLSDKFTAAAARRGVEQRKLRTRIGELRIQVENLQEEKKKLEAMENFTKLMRNGRAIEQAEEDIVKSEAQLRSLPPVKLRSLDMTGCVQVTDDGVIALCMGVPTLQTLRLNMCEGLTDRAVKGIATGLQDSLRSLSLANVDQVTDAGIAALGESCPNLASLKIKGVPQVTMPATAKVVRF